MMELDDGESSWRQTRGNVRRHLRCTHSDVFSASASVRSDAPFTDDPANKVLGCGVISFSTAGRDADTKKAVLKKMPDDKTGDDASTTQRH